MRDTLMHHMMLLSMVGSLAGCVLDDAEDPLEMGAHALPAEIDTESSPITSGKFLVIGDSLATATHANDMCGAGGEVDKCLRRASEGGVLGSHDTDWSYAAGVHSWSLARRLGYSASQVVNRAGDGERWKDALSQAQAISAGGFTKVFIGLGGNDICRDKGFTYTQSYKDTIVNHINNTLTYLTNNLGSGKEVYIAAPPNIRSLRNNLSADHNNYLVNSCNDLWNLNTNAVTTKAAQSLCKSAGYGEWFCNAFDDLAGDVFDDLVAETLDDELKSLGVREGPCGRVLANGADLSSVESFQNWLNTTLANDAAQFNGRNGVKVIYTQAAYNQEIWRKHVSKLDCYHPNRYGQMMLAYAIARDLKSQYVSINDSDTYVELYDQIGSSTTWKSNNNGTHMFASGWYEGGKYCGTSTGGEDGFSIGPDGGWLKVQKNSSHERNRVLQRHLGSFLGKEGMVISFLHRRRSLDRDNDWVRVHVRKPDGTWALLDTFQGAGNDVGEHTGKYYNLTPYIGGDMRLCIEPQNDNGLSDGDRVMFDDFHVLAW
jgi:lysophospholipase L1-like esterase